MENKIRVVVKKVLEQATVQYIENDYKAMQELVGGTVQIVPYWPSPLTYPISMYCNEEGKHLKLVPHFQIPGDTIVGNVFFSRTDSEGDMVSITDLDIAAIEKAYGWRVNLEQKV